MGDTIGFRQQLSTTSFETCELEIAVNYLCAHLNREWQFHVKYAGLPDRYRVGTLYRSGRPAIRTLVSTSSSGNPTTLTSAYRCCSFMVWEAQQKRCFCIIIFFCIIRLKSRKSHSLIITGYAKKSRHAATVKFTNAILAVKKIKIDK